MFRISKCHPSKNGTLDVRITHLELDQEFWAHTGYFGHEFFHELVIFGLRSTVLAKAQV